MKYEVITVGEFDSIKATDDEGNICFIPFDEANSDYQAYLKSLDEAASL